MSRETELDDLSIIKRGYERFLSGDNLDNAIITVRRQQQITTHFGPLTTKNKIKVSLSQEQILNHANKFQPKIQRSQSINIQKSLVPPCGLPKIDVNSSLRNSIRPSLIPIKIKERPKLHALTLEPNHDRYTEDFPKYRSIRELSAPFERRNYVAQQESTLSSLPLPMTQSLKPSFKQYDDLLEKFKCEICSNVLRDARVLDCLHTFCLECLQENASQSKATANKLRSSSIERYRPDMSSSCGSEDFKENSKKMSKSLASTKPIWEALSLTKKKKTSDEQKVSHSN